MTRSEAVRRLREILGRYSSARPADVGNSVPASLGAGKPYELYCLATLLEHMVVHEGLQYQFVHSGGLQFRLKGGPRSPDYAHIHAFDRNGDYFGTLWTDVTFAGLSAHEHVCAYSLSPGFGRVHELDICLVRTRQDFSHICHHEILVGVECKDRDFTNALLKEALGVRREMTLLRHGQAQATGLAQPDRAYVPADPPSWLYVFSSTTTIERYNAPGSFYGIHFSHV